ncbi:LPXTG cell wall anchor domain-containing protein [Streptomyces mexicanus]|uniref:LPXTG cell wall anchor domain-containing protein n=1 Tax=Streptomyces mexicanus TaxID=178566 RepID=A0A7X1I727_9ACTN|nr:LPXTG cell wall anchor domain-containing protein [Streptomyces mexicanus]MBC2869967.1 LPXTG cell wall anchor domain-containing protein [Streptomyces mexicanus]
MLTATAAGTLLGALWFVPSANATDDAPARTVAAAQSTAQVQEQQRPASATDSGSGSGSGVTRVAATTRTAASSADGTELADTGSIDTTPYVVGGTVFLALGAGFVVYSVRRERLGF